MSNLMKTLEDVSKKRQELTEQMKVVLSEGIKEFMIEHPEVKALGWTQFTPYFMDGEECVFSVNDLHVSFTDEREDSLYDEGWEELYSDCPENVDTKLWDQLHKFEDLLHKAEEDLRAAFGDHVQVIITQDGIVTEEYEHE